MIYPNNFEEKIGFDAIRQFLSDHCLSSLGQSLIDEIQMMTSANEIIHKLKEVSELQQLLDTTDDFPLNHYFDVRQTLIRLKFIGTHADEGELFDIIRSLQTIQAIISQLNHSNDNNSLLYPTLAAETTDIESFPNIIKAIDSVLDQQGFIRDNASIELLSIRTEISNTQKSLARTLSNILKSAQNEGLIDKDVAPTMREGRLVIPIVPSLKRKIPGIVHDESASGRTVFVEPAQLVESNNRIRELKNKEQKEILRILVSVADIIRPYIEQMLNAYRFLAKIDLLYAKTIFAKYFNASVPQIAKKPAIDWIEARHPWLEQNLKRQDKRIVPLNIALDKDSHILVISGPNAGGKSVCLKTVGLLQYMIQCGLPVPLNNHSTMGVFSKIMLDMGDEQSIDDDLSTYSSHLRNMKQMIKSADNNTLLLIDEFGGGTEPLIGGAIAQSLLNQFWKQKAWGVITTHYQNLKHFADSHQGVRNAAMLYDRHEMRPLFTLEIGRPGSSFAIEIALKTGLPAMVIEEASNLVGSDYINSDKYLQDIVRDKRYWESKRQTIHQREKEIEKSAARYKEKLIELETRQKDIINEAKAKAEHLLNEANKRIENTIRHIKESQAEKEDTRTIRAELDKFKSSINQTNKKLKNSKQQKPNSNKATKPHFDIGDNVRIIGQSAIGTIKQINGKSCIVIFGDIMTKTKLDRLEHTNEKPAISVRTSTNISRTTRETIDHRREHFKQDLDVRGMRADEAINAVTYFLDDALLVGVSQVRILHGTGDGILRQIIRQYLSTQQFVSSFKDEHVQFGGAGITVVVFNY